MVSALNARFRAGTPSDDPASAGVVVHRLDNRDAYLARVSTTRHRVRLRPFRHREGQIVSCSIMNAQLPFLSVGHIESHSSRPTFPGFVLRPSAVKRALLCSYPYDACTNKALCPSDWRSSDACVPGCPSAANPRLERLSTRAQACQVCVKYNSPRPRLSLSQTMLLHQSRVANGEPHGWPSTRRHEGESPAATLERARLAVKQELNQYNELVLAADTINLPSAIEAVYYMLPHKSLTDAQVSCSLAHYKARLKMMQGRSSAEARAEVNQMLRKQQHLQKNQTLARGAHDKQTRRVARTVHANLLHNLNRTAQQLPLLELDMSNPVEPFRVSRVE